MKVKWSIRKPTKPGWYWVADYFQDHWDLYPRIVLHREKPQEHDLVRWGPRIEEPEPPEVKP